MGSEAVILVGIQATGKSTFCRDRFFRTHVRINLDMLKTRSRERVLLEACLASGQSFVVDNTNPTSEDRARYIQPAREAGFKVVGYYFESALQGALDRNEARPIEERVPKPGVLGTHGRLGVPSPAEGFDELWYVRIGDAGGFIVEEWAGEV